MLLKLALNAVAFYVTAYLLPGMEISGWTSLLVVSIVWGVLTLILKPILLILTLPITILTLGLSTFVINAVLILIMDKVVGGFVVDGFTTALLASVILSIVNIFLSRLANNN